MDQYNNKNEKDARIIYSQIIDHPHWQSPTREHMSLYDRSAQFAPFAALSGFDDMISDASDIINSQP